MNATQRDLSLFAALAAGAFAALAAVCWLKGESYGAILGVAFAAVFAFAAWLYRLTDQILSGRWDKPEGEDRPEKRP
jgi:hypothetical protein